MKAPSLNSLRVRLVAIAAAAGLAGVLAAGGVMTSLYSASLRDSFDERLDVHLTSLIAMAVDENARLAEPTSLGDPDFTIPQSGWAWQIETADAAYLSRSLTGERLKIPQSGGAPIIRADVAAMGFIDLRLASRRLTLPGGTRATFTVVGDPAEIERSIDAFLRAVLITLSVLAAAIMLAASAQVRIGLAPLDAMRRDVSDIVKGRRERLEGDYPDEVAPLVAELNGLLRLNGELIERARTHVGNLAHALKTPLSVIVNEARDRGDDKIIEQSALMRERIDIALDRARMAARSGAIGEVSAVAPALEGLVRVMRKIHGREGCEIALAVAPDLAFRGERQDFEELSGNLIDNACKWATARVSVEARALAPGRLALIVADDGPGLPEAQRAEALKRGRRLDETVPGSGLGLSIVTELVELYGGEIALGDAALGGLEVTVVLPSIEPDAAPR